MATLKLILFAVVLLGIGIAGFAIKLFFQKDAAPVNTSCGSVGPDLEKKGVDACATGGCSQEQIDSCKSEGKIEVKPLELVD